MHPSSGLPSESRGLAPEALLEQIWSAAPYLFAEGGLALEEWSFLEPLRICAQRVRAGQVLQLSPVETFELGLLAHWATCGSFAPTDVEGQIRQKLWDPGLGPEPLGEMAQMVLRAAEWPTRALSHRWVKSPLSGEYLTAHGGEWLSVALAAYAANLESHPDLARALRDRIEFEVTRFAKVFFEFKRARDGRGLLQAAALISHHLGDLDRVIEAWGLMKAGDPLAHFVYRAGQDAGSGGVPRFSGALLEAGRLNQAYMALENHRHIPLRAARALRKSRDFLLPLAPFWDEWGRMVAKHPALWAPERAEVIDALVMGWERLRAGQGSRVTHAYPRALAGLLEAYPGGASSLSGTLPESLDRALKSGLLRSLISVPRARFEEQWSQMALNFLR